METIDLGFKKFEVTRQAFIVFIALIISFFAQLIILIFFVEGSGFMAYTIFIIYIAVMIPLIVYANNCFVTGKCVVLSWVVSMIYLGIAIINVIALIIIAMVINKKDREELISTGMRIRPRRSKKSSR
jgi:hypothetical protein